MNMLMGIFWFCAGATLLGAQAIGKQIESVHPDRATFIGVFAMVLAAYNFVRWWAARTRRKARDAEAVAAGPPKKRLVEKAPPAEYNPEFDFTRNDSPPANGSA
jgi:hypothetical protein